MSEKLPSPHGGLLKPLLVQENERDDYLDEAKNLPKIRTGSSEFSDLVMMATGAFSPLEGFMDREDYLGVINEMHLADGTLWPIPVTLSCTKEEAKLTRENGKIALQEPEQGKVVGIMTVQEKYEYDKTGEAKLVFGTDDEKHPGVNRLLAQGDVYLAGKVKVFSEGEYPQRFTDYARPAETREIFTQKGWKSIVAFQTRNPIHRSHEYITKLALELFDGLFIHPIVGKLKEGDIPADVRLKCIKVLIDRYYPPNRVVLKVYPMEMRYAGPREALLHAIIRQNFGCTHLIVGRDHAGIGQYYGPFDAQDIFDSIPPGSLEIKPLKMDWTFWCNSCLSMASPRTCPHDQKDHLMISGTTLREMLSRGEVAPAEFSRPEVLKVLVDYYTNSAV